MGVLTLTPSCRRTCSASRTSVQRPDLQCVFVPGSYKEGKHYVLDDYPGVTGGWWQHRPLSRGHVRARSTDVYEDPLSSPLPGAQPDQEAAVAGMKIIRGLLHSPALAKYQWRNGAGRPTQHRRAVADFCKHHGSTGYHLRARPAWARRPIRCRWWTTLLRVRGVANLRVIDASGHARDHLRQHLCRHADDRREGRGSGSRQTPSRLIPETLIAGPPQDRQALGAERESIFRRRPWPNTILMPIFSSTADGRRATPGRSPISTRPPARPSAS